MKNFFKKIPLKQFVILAAMPMFALSGIAHAAPISGSGSVTYTGLYGDGTLVIGLTVNIADPVCPGNRIVVSPNHASIKNFQASAMLAKSNGSPVIFATNGCATFVFNGVTYNFPTIDASANNYFIVMP